MKVGDCMKIFHSRDEALSTIENFHVEFGIDEDSFDDLDFDADWLEIYAYTSTLDDFVEHFQKTYGCSRERLEDLYYAYMTLCYDSGHTFLLIR